MRAQARSGFTLIELLLALVLTAVVALLVYGTVQAGIDTRLRLESTLRERQTARAVRAILEDALRNIRAPASSVDSVFMLLQSEGSGGRLADQLRFVSGGGLPPLSTEADWIVMVESAPSGLRLSAAAIGVQAPPRLLALLPSVTGLEIRVRAAGAGEWSRGWADPALLPRGVSITFWADSGALADPVEVALPLAGRP